MFPQVGLILLKRDAKPLLDYDDICPEIGSVDAVSTNLFLLLRILDIDISDEELSFEIGNPFNYQPNPTDLTHNLLTSRWMNIRTMRYSHSTAIIPESFDEDLEILYSLMDCICRLTSAWSRTQTSQTEGQLYVNSNVCVEFFFNCCASKKTHYQRAKYDRNK